jgi:hypothetical protein
MKRAKKRPGKKIGTRSVPVSHPDFIQSEVEIPAVEERIFAGFIFRNLGDEAVFVGTEGTQLRAHSKSGSQLLDWREL